MIFEVLFFLITKLTPVGVAFMVFMWLRESGWIKSGISVLSLSIVWALFSSYTDFFPLEYSYRNQFEQHTGYPFPNSGTFLYKQYTYPDLMDEYTVTGLIQTNQEDFKDILSSIKQNSNFIFDSSAFKFKDDYLAKSFHEWDFTERYTFSRKRHSIIFTISFNPRMRLIHFKRDNW
jgi:hypothetical protein